MNPKMLLLLLAALAAKAQAEAQAQAETPCDCPGCAFNRALDSLLEARKASDAAKAEYDAADRKRSFAIGAMTRAQGAFDAAADALNKAGRAEA